MKKSTYITKDKKIFSGAPIIKGTRIPVSSVLGYISGNGLSLRSVKRIYPELTKKQLEAVLDYPKNR